MIAQPSEFTRRIGGAVVAATAADHLATQAAAVLDLFESRADELVDGFSIQTGWAPFILIERGEGRLDVAAPDFATKTPEHVGWVTDLTLVRRCGPLGRRIGLVCEWAGIGRIIASSNSEGVTCPTRTTMGLR